MPQEKETKGPRRLYTKVEYVDPSAVRRPHRKSSHPPLPIFFCFFVFVCELADGQGRESPFQAQARRDDDTSTVLSTAVTRPKPEFVTSHDVTFSGFGPGTAGPARSLQADTPLSWHGVPNYIKKMTQVIN